MILNENQLYIKSQCNFLNENYVFSKKDIEYRLKDFINKRTNILFITGLAGSGKSTLGKKIAEIFECNYIELDMVNQSIKKKYSKEEYEKLKKSGEKDKLVLDEIYKIIKKTKKQAVVEGFESVSRVDTITIKSNSVLIINTSFLVSYLRTQKRQFDKNYIDRYGFNPLRTAVFFINENRGYYDKLREFEKKVIKLGGKELDYKLVMDM